MALDSSWPPTYDDTYMPPHDQRYWFPELETMPAPDRQAYIVAKLRHVIDWAYARSPFYRRKWDAAGVCPESLRSLDDLARFPVVTKAELRADQAEHAPFGSYLCIDPSEIARIHGTSGTTGKPTAFAIGRDDWRRIANAHARVMWAMGLRPGDTVFIGSFFSLYLGSWGALVGAERLGAASFPFGAGAPGQTAMAVRWLRETRPTAFYGTPSYALHLAEVARSEGVEPREFGLKILFFSGEPGAGIPATRRQIQATFGGKCFDCGNMAEMTPWMTNGECAEQTGVHLWQDITYAEVCDPESHQPLPPGSRGTPVYTHLERTSQPMIRLLSGDLATWTDEPCACGRTYPRLPGGLFGRIDDMFTVRGENVYPSAVEDVLVGTPGYGGEYRLVISRTEAMDELVVQIEIDEATRQRGISEPGSLQTLSNQVAGRLRATLGIRAIVELELPGSLPRTEFKARRVVDDRELYRELSRPSV
jgi:phenylacetate-CoA ligase